MTAFVSTKMKKVWYKEKETFHTAIPGSGSAQKQST